MIWMVMGNKTPEFPGPADHFPVLPTISRTGPFVENRARWLAY